MTRFNDKFIEEKTDPGCPLTHEFNPFSQDFLVDPYVFYKKWRELGSVVYSPEFDAYLVTRYQAIMDVLENRDVFSASNAQAIVTPLCKEAQEIVEGGYPRVPTFTNADPPRHTKIRNVAMKVLTPRRWKKSQSEIAEYAEGLVEVMAKKPESDLMADLMLPVPMYAAFRFIGFPMEDIDMLKRWCAGRVAMTYGRLPPEKQVEGAKSLIEFWNYAREFVEKRQHNPEDDLVSDWLAFVDSGLEESLTFDDVVNMTFSVALAAHETTTNAMMNGVKTLMLNPDAWEEICRNPSLIPNAVEELMRYDSPMFVHRRRCKEHFDLHGTIIPEGATIMLLIGSGHRDERRFPQPDTLDIHRKDANRHLSFGYKWHFCLGAPLARFEFNRVLQLLTKYVPKMMLVEDQEFKYVPILLLRGVERVLVRPQG